MACNVIRNSKGQVEQVYADNGKPSILFNSLFKELGNKEAAHTAWLKTRTETFKHWFKGSVMVDENGEPKIYRDILSEDLKQIGEGLETSLFRPAPIFINSSTLLKEEEIVDLPVKKVKSATENIGSFKTHDVGSLIAEINTRYKLKDPFTGQPVNYHTGNLISAISKAIRENYPGIEVSVRENAFGKFIDVYSPDYIEPDNIYHQLENEDINDADLELNQTMEVLLDDLGIPVILVDTLRNRDGSPMQGIAKADMIMKVIEVVKGKADITTLPEEAAHFFVEILKATNDPLYTSLYRQVENNPIYQQVLDKYGEHPEYMGNEEKLKDEAIGKIIAKEIVKEHSAYAGDQKLIDRIGRWFKKVWEAIKKYFSRNGNLNNPFRLAAQRMLRENMKKYRTLIQEKNLSTGEMMQLDNAETATTETLDEQQAVVDSIIKVHESLITRLVEKTALPGSLRVIKEFEEGEELERYVFIDADTGQETIVTNRVTDQSTKTFVRKVGLEKALEINKGDRSAHLRKHGIRIHTAAQELLEYYASKSNLIDVVPTHGNGIKSLGQIQKELGLNNTLFGVFKKGVQNLIKEIEATQKEINGEDGKGKAKLLTEVRAYDKFTDTAGTMDAQIVYSDASVDLYDWKTITPNWQYTERKQGGKLKIIENPFQAKMDTYNAQIGTYKDMLRDHHGVKKFRRSRIIPIHVDYKVKNWRQADWRLTDEIETFEMSHTNSEFLQQIAVAMEETGYAAIDKLLTQLDNRVKKLELQKRNIKGKKADFAKLDARIKALNEAIQEILVKGNIKTLIVSAAARITQMTQGLDQTDPAHPSYLTDEDLRAIYEDFAIFQNIVEESTDFLDDMIKKSKDKKEAQAYKKAFILTAGIISRNLNKVQQTWLNRIMDKASQDNVDLNEMPKSQDWMTLNFRSMNQSPHPAFRAAHKKITHSFNKTKHATDTISDMLTDLIEGNEATGKMGLREWGKQQGKTLQQVYTDHFIKDYYNESGEKIIFRNIIPKYHSDFNELVKAKIEAGDTGWMKKNFKFREGARKKFDRMRKNMIEREEFMHPDPTTTNSKGEIVPVPGSKNEKIRKANIKKWDQKYNVFDPVFTKAWLNGNWSMFLEPINEEENYSEEYKFLNQEGNEPLLEFYNYYRSTILKLSDISGIYINPNTVAHIKDDIINSILNTGLNFDGAKEFADSISRSLMVHQEMESRGVYGDDGKLISQIPLLYLNGVDPELKSKDLGRGLYLLANSIYNHKHMGEIESYIMGLREMIIHKGEAVTNRGTLQYQGTNIRRQEASNELLSTYDSFINYYLYGQQIQTEDVVLGGENGISLINTIKGLQSLYSAKVLGFAIIPGIAARLTGGLNMYIEGVDGVQYTNKQLNNARRLFINKNEALGKFVEFFDPFQAGMTWKKSRNLSMNTTSKIFDLDHIYSTLRVPDENMDSVITIAMAQNHGIDKDGVLQRMEDLPEGSKSLWDSFEESFKKGDKNIIVPGLTESVYEDFRMRVKAVAGRIKGEMNHENVRVFDMTLHGQLLMHFKGWMPSLLLARLGRMTPEYDHVLNQLQEGRYWGFLKGEGVGSHGKEMVKNEYGLKLILEGTLKRALEVTQELIFLKKYTTNPLEVEKLRKEGKWSDSQNKDYLRRKKALQMEFELWKRNSTDPKVQGASLNEYLKMRQRSVRQTLSEIRILIGLWAAAMAMGMGVGPDDEKWSRKSWTSRKLFMLLSRVRMELGFSLNPMEFATMIRGAIPLIGLLTDSIKVVNNGWQETLEMLGVIAENPRDKTPMFYHTLKFLPGWSQLRRILEVYDQDKINPYTYRGM